MQQDNDNTLITNSDAIESAPQNIHELFSCENISALADKHRELSMGLFSSVNGGAELNDISSIITLLVDQAEELSSMLSMKVELEKETLSN